MEIIPTPLTSTLQEFTTDMQKLSPVFSIFHLDIADGVLVDGQTVTVEEIVPRLHEYKNASFDFHLMVSDYKPLINYLKTVSSQIKIRNVFIHYKARPDKGFFVSQSGPFTIGLVINPDEQVKELSTYYSFGLIPAVQIMTVNPGRQGQGFIKETLNKIEQLRLLDYRNKIFLDGSINKETLPSILSQRYLPDILNVGSYFSRADNVKERLQILSQMLPS